MFAYLNGKILDKEDNTVILDVNGVGYLLYCSSRTQDKLGAIGEMASAYIETHVREDHIHLFGFADKDEKNWFKILTGVQGVGAKVGIAILSALSPSEIHHAIIAQDKAMISRADGVGPKLAARITNELKDKVNNLALKGVSTGDVQQFGSSGEGKSGLSAQTALYQDAQSALANLGYRRFDVDQVIRQIMASDDHKNNLQEIIRLALKKLSSDRMGGAA